MKKFFLFAAAAIAAMTVNAKVYNFAGITADQITTDGTIGTYVMDEVEIPSVSQPDGVDINVTLEGQEGLVINYTQSAGKKKDNILKFAANFMQADGKNVILTFSDVTVGDQIKLVVSAKGSTDAKFTALEGASGAEQTVTKIDKVEDFATVTFTATDSDVKIKEIGGGFRIVSATLGAGSGDDPGDDPGEDPGDDPVPGSFVGFDGRAGDFGAQIAGGLLADEVNLTLSKTSDGKYSFKNTEAGEVSFSLGGVIFKGSDQQAGKDIYKSFGTYIQPNGARRSVVIPTAAGEKVLIGVQDAITFAVEGAAEGASVSFQGWGSDKDVLNTLTATGSEIVLWSDDRAESPQAQKFKLGVVLPAGTQGVENVFEAEKAVKFIHNGQVVVKKGNRFFNILGAEITL